MQGIGLPSCETSRSCISLACSSSTRTMPSSMARVPGSEPPKKRISSRHLAQGAVTPSYGGDVKRTIEILQTVLATEIVCVPRYTMHAVAASGISSDSVKEEFAQQAKEEQQHMMDVAERINQLAASRISIRRGWRCGPPRNTPKARTWSI